MSKAGKYNDPARNFAETIYLHRLNMKDVVQNASSSGK
jgi:hypothetical protein